MATLVCGINGVSLSGLVGQTVMFGDEHSHFSLISYRIGLICEIYFEPIK
jgi:hypothetical protein